MTHHLLDVRLRAAMLFCALLPLSSCGGSDVGEVCEQAKSTARVCGLDSESASTGACESALDGCNDSDADKLTAYYECLEDQGQCSDGMIAQPQAALGCLAELSGLSEDCLPESSCSTSSQCLGDSCVCRVAGRSCCDDDECSEDDPDSCSQCEQGNRCTLGECTCIVDGDSCCDPDVCGEDDPNSCDTVCRVCTSL